MHLDINSCFATIEQQANPLLRGKPIAVAVYPSPNACIVASSIEAKRFGVKTGMKVKEGKFLFPNLVILEPDPWKYRNVHLALKKLLSEYTFDLTPKSIDEFVLDFEKFSYSKEELLAVARKIKKKIRRRIGEWISVSIGLGPNRFLAKVASNLRKPDGLEVIDKSNFLEVYSKISLQELPYIKSGNALRLKSVGIDSVLDFYNASYSLLKIAFGSANAYYWYLRIAGWEIDDVSWQRRSFGISYVLPASIDGIFPILMKLTTKLSAKMRLSGYAAKGIRVFFSFRDGTNWVRSVSFQRQFFSASDIYKEVKRIALLSPRKLLSRISLSFINLVPFNQVQLSLFEDVERKLALLHAVDKVNDKFGDFVVSSARMIGCQRYVPDRVAFGDISGLERLG